MGPFANSRLTQGLALTAAGAVLLLNGFLIFQALGGD
jgi:hypothetical protein